jgi:hypothetical protein
MTGSDIVAIIGAAAWVPQIVRWVYKALRKAKLELISAPKLVLGYTSSGPFLQLTASVSSQNRDVIVTKMNISRRHQSGEQRRLQWSSVTESLASFQVPTESPVAMNMSKPQSVLAIKATTETLSERHIAFIDLRFVGELQDKVNLAREHFKYLSGEVTEPTEQMLHSKEFKEAQQFSTESIFWREGVYRLDLEILGRQLNTPHLEVLRINLTRQDIEEMQLNVDLVRQDLKNQIIGLPRAYVNWHFIYPFVIHMEE